MPWRLLALTCVFTAGLSTFASAQTEAQPQELMPARSLSGVETNIPADKPYELSPKDDTHATIRLTPDKSEIVRLDAEADSIIVGNPAHLNVLMDDTKTLILVPRNPGATYFTVLDKGGKVVMQRHAIVAAPKENYIRVRRSCANAQGNCTETSVYYCPDMCHSVGIMSADQGMPTPPEPTPPARSFQSDDGMSEENIMTEQDVPDTTDSGDPSPSEPSFETPQEIPQ